jgi:glucose/arabinose dehydrogenase
VRRLALSAVLTALLVPAPAFANDYFVGNSRPGASDAGACDSAAAPCVTIQAAVDKAKASAGNRVVVLANTDGQTTDEYDENVNLNGPNPVTLVGAGSGVNGTLIWAQIGRGIVDSTGSTIQHLHVVARDTNRTAIDQSAVGGIVQDGFVEAPKGTAYVGRGTVRDSTLRAVTGAQMITGRIVRSVIAATGDGVWARRGTTDLLNDIVRGARSNGLGLKAGNNGFDAGLRIRHVSVTNFPTQVYMYGRANQADLQAADSTLIGKNVDLVLDGPLATANLATTNLSIPRTSFVNGAQAAQLTKTDPVSVEPRLTNEGRLLPFSGLIDRGTAGGVLAGDPDDAQDFEGEPRVQRTATDVGADELPPIGPTYPHFVPAGNFATPIYLTGPPNDPHRVFVVERAGTIRIINDGAIEPTPFLDISSLVTTVGEGGLLSMAFAPDYATSRRFYVYYAGVPDPTDGGLQGDIHVAEFQAKANNPDQADPNSRRELLHIDHSEGQHHYGGQLQIAPDGMLWISTGDGDVNANLAQDRTSLLGKLLRIDPHPSGSLPYSIPPDNPYANCGCSFRPEIWAYGLRNPWRWSFDRETGDIIIGDVGKSDFDEIDYVPAGRPGGMNFGWPITEGDMLLSTRERVTPATAPPNYLGPITVRRQLDGNSALVGGFVVHDPNLAALAGRYVYADYFNGQLRSARLSVGGTIDDKEIAGLDAHQNQDAFGQDQCGRLYVIQITGPVYRLTATGPSTMGQEAQGVDCVPLPAKSPSVKTATAPVEGTTLSAQRGEWSGEATIYRVQWARCDSDGTSDCTGVTPYRTGNGSYTPTSADVGHTLRVRVIATNGTGDSLPALSPPTAPVTPKPTVPNTRPRTTRISRSQVRANPGANPGRRTRVSTA